MATVTDGAMEPDSHCWISVCPGAQTVTVPGRLGQGRINRAPRRRVTAMPRFSAAPDKQTTRTGGSAIKRQ